MAEGLAKVPQQQQDPVLVVREHVEHMFRASWRTEARVIVGGYEVS